VNDTKITLPSFAKINLSLRVLGRRADGYPRIGLDKQIPVGGGLGGGSSNAAVALLGLSNLWQLRLSFEQMTEIAAAIGADVPFFLTGGTALGTGTGTDIQPLDDAASLSLIVIAPGVKVSTAEAYRALNATALTKADTAVMLPISRGEADFSDSLPTELSRLENDFEGVILRQHREIDRAKTALKLAGASRAMLSGSGSSVFGVFDNEGHAQQALGSLKLEDRWQVFISNTLSRVEYRQELIDRAAFRTSPV
jgi:4-diphosphocytidyl-2-C-methyl-D-erythritol kinase